jgi:hypothetical protein
LQRWIVGDHAQLYAFLAKQPKFSVCQSPIVGFEGTTEFDHLIFLQLLLRQSLKIPKPQELHGGAREACPTMQPIKLPR